jgi:hypothetical protein
VAWRWRAAETRHLNGRDHGVLGGVRRIYRAQSVCLPSYPAPDLPSSPSLVAVVSGALPALPACLSVCLSVCLSAVCLTVCRNHAALQALQATAGSARLGRSRLRCVFGIGTGRLAGDDSAPPLLLLTLPTLPSTLAYPEGNLNRLAPYVAKFAGAGAGGWTETEHALFLDGLAQLGKVRPARCAFTRLETAAIENTTSEN